MSEQKTIHHKTRKAADISLAKRQISPASHRAVLDGELTLQAARDLGRDRGPDDTGRATGGPGTATRISRGGSAEGDLDGPDTPPQPVSTISKDDTRQFCWCGCEDLTSPGKRWKPGHDQRAKGIIRRVVKEGKAAELSPQLREYGAERRLL